MPAMPPSKTDPKRIVGATLLLGTIWYLWSGHTEPFVLTLGAISLAITIFFAVRMKVIDSEGYPFEIAAGLVRYVPWLVWQIIVSNLVVAKLILHPKLPIRPAMVRVPANQRTVLGRVVHANSITITPGTISLDVTEDSILVHTLLDTMDPTDDLNHRVTRLEGNLP